MRHRVLAVVNQQACYHAFIVQQKVTAVLPCSRLLLGLDCCTQAGVHYIEGRATVKDKHTVTINGKDYTVGSHHRPTLLHTAAVAQYIMLPSHKTSLGCYTVHSAAGTLYILLLLHSI